MDVIVTANWVQDTRLIYIVGCIILNLNNKKDQKTVSWSKESAGIRFNENSKTVICSFVIVA